MKNTTNNSNISIGIINLKTASARRERLSAQFSNLGIDFYFFEALAPKHMSEDEKEMYKSMHKPFETMTDGQFGCDLSHYYIMQDWYHSQKSDYLLIIEDDAIIHDGFKYLIENSNFLDNYDFDCLKFGGLPKTRNRIGIKVGEINRFEIVYPITYTNGTQAYVVSRKNYQKIEKIMREFHCPVDLRIFDLVPFDVKILELSPFVILQTDEESTIGVRAKKPKKTILKRIKNELSHVSRQIMNFARGLYFYGFGKGFTMIKGDN